MESYSLSQKGPPSPALPIVIGRERTLEIYPNRADLTLQELPIGEFNNTPQVGFQRRPRGHLRVAFLTPTLLMGGAERWMISLARSCDPRRIEWTGTALSEGAPADAELCHEMAAYMPVYAGPGAGPPEGSPYITRRHSPRAALDAALAEADVLVSWGTHDLGRLVAG